MKRRHILLVVLTVLMAIAVLYSSGQSGELDESECPELLRAIPEWTADALRPNSGHRGMMIYMSVPPGAKPLGPTEVKIIITAADTGGALHVGVVLADGIELDGPDKFVDSSGIDYCKEYTIRLNFHKKDTLIVMLQAYARSNSLRYSLLEVVDQFYFVTTGDTLEVYHSDPKGSPFNRPKKLGKRRGWSTPGEFPVKDSVYGPAEPPYEIPVPTLKQVALSEEDRERVRRESEIMKKERLEQSPLVGQPIQTVWIGDSNWTRYEGETVFKRGDDSLFKNRPMLFQAYVDSVELLPDDAEIDVCIYFPDSIHVARAREIVPDIPIDFSAKFFHATLTKAWIKKLREMRLYVQYVHAKPHQYHGPDAPKDIRRKLN